MAYVLNCMTIRTNNTHEGISKIDELWKDIVSGKLPILFDSEHNFQNGLSPVSRYSNYDENGNYDLSILGVRADFFKELENTKDAYKKYDFCAEDISKCTKNAWKTVWDDQKNGLINRSYTIDYESTVPAEYSKDGKAHCYLYIAVK